MKPALLALALVFTGCTAPVSSPPTTNDGEGDGDATDDKKRGKEVDGTTSGDHTAAASDDSAGGATGVPGDTPALCKQAAASALNANTSPCPLFGASSPWNKLALGSVDPNSAAMAQNLRAAFTKTGHTFDLAGTGDYPDYGVPLYYADASTPKVMMKDSTGWWPGMTMPLPPSAAPSVGTDHHLSIWDVSTNTLYEVWDARKAGDGSWSGGLGAKFDAAGSGYQTTKGAGSARALWRVRDRWKHTLSGDEGR